MEIYIALRDTSESIKSTLVGAFSDEARARNACQESADEEAGLILPPIAWREGDTRGELPDGAVYDVVLCDLDQRIF